MLSARKSQHHYRTQDGITWLWIKSSNDLTSILVTYSETLGTENNTPAILLFLEHSILFIYHWTTVKSQFLEPPFLQSSRNIEPKVFFLSLLEQCTLSPISRTLRFRFHCGIEKSEFHCMFICCISDFLTTIILLFSRRSCSSINCALIHV